MKNLKKEILTLLASEPGLTDREITDRLRGRTEPQQATNQACRRLEADGLLIRARRGDGLLGNNLTGAHSIKHVRREPTPTDAGVSEDEVKEALQRWLRAQGWSVEIAWGHAQGPDLDARKGGTRWLIEAKGCGSSQPMRVNYFLGVLGEVLQRMADPDAKYSIAMPDMPQYRSLWRRLPSLTKGRTGLTALFVTAAGEIQEQS